MIHLTRTVERLLLPPPGLLWLLLPALWLLARERRRAGRGLIWLSVVVLYLGSIPATANFLTFALLDAGSYPALGDADLQRTTAQAIVILGNGRYYHAPEYGGVDTLTSEGLARARYGARLQRRTGLPILVAGGSFEPDEMSEGELMKQVLTGEFGVPVRWVESTSRTTWENARHTSAVLEREGIRRILLVTHGRDIKRAVWSFRRAGTLEVTPAPTLLATPIRNYEVKHWIPNVFETAAIANILHEAIGLVWYRWRQG